MKGSFRNERGGAELRLATDSADLIIQSFGVVTRARRERHVGE